MTNEILIEMLSHYGLSEIDGPLANPHILEFFDEIGFNWVTDDSTSWCSAVLNFFAKKHGFERSGSLTARSWLKVGEIVIEPQLGDIVVFWRGAMIVGWATWVFISTAMINMFLL